MISPNQAISAAAEQGEMGDPHREQQDGADEAELNGHRENLTVRW